jgi:hypothetical protein
MPYLKTRSFCCIENEEQSVLIADYSFVQVSSTLSASRVWRWQPHAGKMGGRSKLQDKMLDLKLSK